MASRPTLGRAIAAATALIVAGCGDLTPPGRSVTPDAGTGPKQPSPSTDAACGPEDWADLIVDDRDGDGVMAWWTRRCGQRHAGAPVDKDCDDTDPSRSQRSWRDADGDGFTLATEECFAALPPGYAARPSRDADCDDDDPLRQQTFFVDADGDGFGGKDPTRCVQFVAPGTAPPEGLSRDALDCDDADRTRHPWAYEQWNDGVDSDCDGEDAPLDCNRGECGCQLRSIDPPLIDATCAGTDLFVAARRVCRSSCGAYNVVVIANRGTEAFTGGFDLTLEGDATRLRVQGDLAPGAFSLPIKLRAGAASVNVIASPSECDPTNNAAPLEAIPIPCVE